MERGFRTDGLLIGLTAARLGFIPVILAAFTHSAAITSAAIVLFVITDLYDGILARRLGADGPTRRAIDSAVDRLAIDSCLIGAGVAGALPLPILAVLLTRDAYLSIICARMMRKRKVAIKADLLYRALNLSVAGWALAVPFVSTAAVAMLAGALLAFSLFVAADLTILVRKVLSAPPEVRDTVIGASTLRHTASGQISRPNSAVFAD